MKIICPSRPSSVQKHIDITENAIIILEIKRSQFSNTTKWPTFIDAKVLRENKNSPRPDLKTIMHPNQTTEIRLKWEHLHGSYCKTSKLKEYSEIWQLLQFYHWSNHLSSKYDNSRPLSKKSAGPTGFSFQSNPLINRLNVFSSEKPFNKQVFRKDPILVSSFLILSI